MQQQSCYNHAHREAAARCPECGRFFCRECVTEHDDRVLCAPCLARVGRAAKRGRRWGMAVVRLGACLASFVLLWMFFFTLGKGLLALPSSFHNTAMFQAEDSDS